MNKESKYPFAYYGNPILRKEAVKIEKVTDEIRDLAANLIVIMRETDGIGLAAPQISHSLQALSIDLTLLDENLEPQVYLNPEILSKKDEQLGEEGCLSLPGIFENVKRPDKITVKYMDLNENYHTKEAEGLLARVFCHEIDHLKGVLFVDHLSKIKQALLKGKLEKINKEYNS